MIDTKDDRHEGDVDRMIGTKKMVDTKKMIDTKEIGGSNDRHKGDQFDGYTRGCSGSNDRHRRDRTTIDTKEIGTWARNL
jgi:hypothetical protein